MGVDIPDGRRPAIFRDSSFDLIGGGGCAPGEITRKGHRERVVVCGSVTEKQPSYRLPLKEVMRYVILKLRVKVLPGLTSI
jgi:hypothetical protein